jgi:dTDP-4-dehydrorhamnose reductase
MRILILGSNGMIGHTLFNYLSKIKDYDVWGAEKRKHNNKKIIKLNIGTLNDLDEIFENEVFDLVINCIGITKHRKEFENISEVILMNSALPWKLLYLSKKNSFRLIHISTDCVFSGKNGCYDENDICDSEDVYGKSKSLGEILNEKNCLTIRTSTIGHEMKTKHGLLEWFLSQKQCKGYSKCIFSGFPTIVLAQIIHKYIIPNQNLFGLFHIGSNSISKYDLLKKINFLYKKKINLIFDDKVVIDRSLNSEKFKLATGYNPPQWNELLEIMKKNNV